ncbi:hypothetical protein CPB86DRAFT_813794 [Serendipita vermifera]|nr:hypothetical protein CPB86DRAFT_813794 [Serendipita vermifera]
MLNLQAASLILPGSSIHRDRPLTILSNVSHLTHLHLQRLTWEDFCNGFAAQNPSLQSLRYLDMGFIDEEESMAIPKVESSPPKLKNLVMRGRLHPRFKEDVDNFLQYCGKTVTQFINV